MMVPRVERFIKNTIYSIALIIQGYIAEIYPFCSNLRGINPGPRRFKSLPNRVDNLGRYCNIKVRKKLQ